MLIPTPTAHLASVDAAVAQLATARGYCSLEGVLATSNSLNTLTSYQALLV